MPAGVLIILQLITALIPVVNEGLSLIKQAQDEGRDVTPEEVAAIQQKTDDLYDSVMQELKVAAGNSEGGG